MPSVLVLVFAAFAAASPWFAQYDLSLEQIENLTLAGCFRGVFGGVYPRSMSLLTCGADTESFANLDDKATLCVVELRSPEMVENAREILLAHPLAAKILFTGRQELVFANPLGPEASTLCCTGHFPDIANNVLFVPTEPVRPQLKWDRPMNRTGVSLSPAIVDMVNNINQANIQTQVFNLATDSSGRNDKITRNSYSLPSNCPSDFKCINNALDYVQSTASSLLASRTGVTYQRFSFQSNMGECLIVRIPGQVTSDLVIIGAHLDSRNNINTNTNNPAPGADDNASGSALNLEYIRVITTLNIVFDFTIEFHWYIGEEQGLLGSKALADNYVSRGIIVQSMWNNDMLGYTVPETGIIMAFMNGAYSSSTLTQWCRNVVADYVPKLKTGLTNACCSDQQSWHVKGIPSVGIFETATDRVAYPQYHTSQDTVDKVNYIQLFQFAQGMISCIGESAIARYASP